MTALKRKRETLKMTQEELARELSVTQQAVAKWESGDGMPRAEMLLKIAEVLNCTTDDLLRPIDVG